MVTWKLEFEHGNALVYSGAMRSKILCFTPFIFPSLLSSFAVFEFF